MTHSSSAPGRRRTEWWPAPLDHERGLDIARRGRDLAEVAVEGAHGRGKACDDAVPTPAEVQVGLPVVIGETVRVDGLRAVRVVPDERVPDGVAERPGGRVGNGHADARPVARGEVEVILAAALGARGCPGGKASGPEDVLEFQDRPLVPPAGQVGRRPALERGLGSVVGGAGGVDVVTRPRPSFCASTARRSRRSRWGRRSNGPQKVNPRVGVPAGEQRVAGVSGGHWVSPCGPGAAPRLILRRAPHPFPPRRPPASGNFPPLPDALRHKGMTHPPQTRTAPPRARGRRRSR